MSGMVVRLGRREFLKISAGAATVAATWPAITACQAPAASRTFTIGHIAEPNALDPRSSYSTPANSVVWRIFEPLLNNDTAKQEIQPQLATSYKVVDSRTYEFDLRKGVKWHDGKEFTAEDVEFSYMMPWTDPMAVATERVDILDKYKVRIVTKDIQAYFLIQDITHNRRILPKHLLSGVPVSQVWDKPIGTGAFKLATWNMGDRVILEANKDYWGGRPAIDQLVVRPIPEAATRVVELEAGGIDMAMDVPDSDVARLAKVANITVIQSPGPGYEYLALNEAHPMLAKREIRQAIAYAIDKDALLKLYPGTAQRCYGPIANGSWFVEKEVNHYDYNLDKAKALLAQAGAADGFKAGLKTVNSYKEMAQAVQLDLRKAGINVDISVLEDATFLNDVKSGNSEMYMHGWVDVVDPDHAYWVFHSERQGGDRIHYKNPRVDELLKQGQLVVDRNQRKTIYSEAQKLIVDDSAFVFLITRDTLRGYRSDRWQGFRQQPMPTDVLNFLPEVKPK